MSALLARIFGSSGTTSEGRMAIAAFLVGLGLIVAGDVVGGVNLLIGAVASYSGARGLAKAGALAGGVLGERLQRRLEEAEKARGASPPPTG